MIVAVGQETTSHFIILCFKVGFFKKNILPGIWGKSNCKENLELQRKATIFFLGLMDAFVRFLGQINLLLAIGLFIGFIFTDFE